VETLEQVGLAVGDVVVYGSHGVGRIAIRREQSIVVEFVNSGLTVIMPVERAIECVRPVSTEAEITSLGRTLGSGDTAVHPNWQSRLKATRAKVAGGVAVDLAEVIRDASRREERAFARSDSAKLSLAERQLYLKARRLLADEIGASRGVDQANADEWIADRIAVNGDRERPPAAPALTQVSGPPAPAVSEPSGKRARRRRQ
jgi:RNA polymerase-interacting CarD/CdnL/TRCF family regulator